MARVKLICGAAGCNQRVRPSQVFCGRHYVYLLPATRAELSTKRATGYWAAHQTEWFDFLAKARAEISEWSAELQRRGNAGRCT